MEHRAPQRVQAPPAVVQQPPAEKWPDVEVRLLGFLRGRVFGAQRTPATAQSLSLQGHNWCAKNEAHLGDTHPERIARMVGAAVAKAMVPSQEEENLLETYGDRGEDIRMLNQGLAEMTDPRVSRWSWQGLLLLAIGVGSLIVAALYGSLDEQLIVGTAMCTIGGAALVIIGLAGVGVRTTRISDGRWRY